MEEEGEVSLVIYNTFDSRLSRRGFDYPRATAGEPRGFSDGYSRT